MKVQRQCKFSDERNKNKNFAGSEVYGWLGSNLNGRSETIAQLILMLTEFARA